MKVTYIYHSSFAVELEKSMLIFDYYGKERYLNDNIILDKDYSFPF